MLGLKAMHWRFLREVYSDATADIPTERSVEQRTIPEDHFGETAATDMEFRFKITGRLTISTILFSGTTEWKATFLFF